MRRIRSTLQEVIEDRGGIGFRQRWKKTVTAFFNRLPCFSRTEERMKQKYALQCSDYMPLASILAMMLTLPVGPVCAGPAGVRAHTDCPKDSEGSSDSLDERILLGAARNAVHRNDLKTAAARFQHLLRRFPDQAQGRLEYAGVLFQLGRKAEAGREYERLHRKHPDDLSIVRPLVDILLSLKEYSRIQAILGPVVARHPDRVDLALDLAKTYSLDGDLDTARAIAEKYVVGKPLITDRMRLDAVELFTQLKRADLAQQPLDELLRSRPRDPRLMAAEIRYLILREDWRTAIQRMEQFEQLYPKMYEVRIELASALYDAGFYVEAGTLFNRLLGALPHRKDVILGAARVALRYNRLRRSKELIESVPVASRGRRWFLTRAEYDIIAGNYRHGEQILGSLLRENPADRDAALALADLERAQQEFLKADCRYASLGAGRGNAAATIHLAESLLLQKRFREAECCCRRVLYETPDDAVALRQMGKTLGAEGRVCEALPYLWESGTLTNETLPEYVYYAHSARGDPAECYVASLSTARRPLYSAGVMFSLALGEGRKNLACCILDAGLTLAPDNIAMRTHAAEWYASHGTGPCAADAANSYRCLLAGNCDNQKWLLGLARADATSRQYEESLAVYGRLHAEQRRNYQIARERVRVICGIDGTMEGLRQYDHLIENWPGLAEERRRLCIERSAKALHVPKPTAAAGQYETLVVAEPYEPHFRFELGQVCGAVGNTPCAIAAYSNLLALDPNHRNAEMALEGKWLDLRDRVFGNYRFRRERGRDGLTSIDRGGAFVGVRHIYDYEDEFVSLGYGRLTLAPTLGEGTAGNCLDVDFQRRLPPRWLWRLAPGGTPYFFVDGCVEGYDRFVSTRPTGMAGLKLRTAGDAVWTVAATLDNVLENHESLRQDIYRGGVFVGLDTMPTPYWELSLGYRFDAYSDVNNRNAAEMRNRFKLTPDPERLSLLVNMDYWDFAEQSVFSPGPDRFYEMRHPYFSPRNFVQADVGVEWKHRFGLGGAPAHGRLLPGRLVAPGLCCQRVGSRYGDGFDGSDQWWISMSARKRWDDQGKNYTIMEGMLVWDITRRLSGYAKAEYLESSVYQSTGAYAGLAYIY